MTEHRLDPLANETRRDFLRALAALGAAAWVGTGCARRGAGGAASGVATSGAATSGAAPAAAASGARAPTMAVRPTIDRVGVQLYTVFGELRQDFEGTLAQVAQIGYKQVEFAGYYDRTPEQIRQLLDRLGLSAPSTHIGLDALHTDLDTQVRFAKVLGHRYITVPSLPRSMGALRTADDWRRVADEFNRLGRTLQQRGVRLAFHSHRDEFVDVGGGRTGMDVFIAETDPTVVFFEMDLGWARVAGQDPAQWFARYPGRFPMWHVKDIKGLAEAQARQADAFRNPPPPPQGPPQPPPAGAPLTGPAPLGEGDIDYRPIFAAWQQAGLEHFFVEQDQATRWPGGALESLRKSYAYMRQLLA